MMQNWLRRNLFASPANIIISLVMIYVLYLIILPIINWAIINAYFSGSDPSVCTKDGACWIYIKVRFNQFMYGFYPDDQQWRINLGYGIGIFAFLILLTSSGKVKRGALVFMLFFLPCICFVLFYGGIFGLPLISTYQWGGLHLTLVVALVGMLFALPIGLLLALGRRSQLPLIRMLCTVFIEVCRGVPLISVLFMASVMLPLFFSSDVYIDKLLRALIGISLFAGAYMAEVVRGGLQAVPYGQYEAAQALGFGYWQQMRLIILPQALTIAIPNIVNTFIALFKDTTLVLIIGLFDFLGMIQAANSDPKWLAYGLEGYVFAALVYWVFCFMMSRYSKNLECNLRGKRRGGNSATSYSICKGKQVV